MTLGQRGTDLVCAELAGTPHPQRITPRKDTHR